MTINALFGFLNIKPCLASDGGKDSSSVRYTYQLGGGVFYGNLMIHTPKIEHFKNLHPYGFDLQLHKNTYGYQRWEKRFNYPDIGFALNYTNLNHNSLGHVIGFFSYLDVPLINLKAFQLRTKLGPGAGYFTNPYDQDKNSENRAIGTHINFGMRGGLLLFFPVYKNVKMGLGAGIMHYSNGAVKNPNLGVNVSYVKANLRYYMQPPRPKNYKKAKMPAPEKKWSIWMQGAGGVYQKTDQINGPLYGMFNLAFKGGKHITPINRWYVGADMFKGALFSDPEKVRTNTNNTNLRIGGLVGHELIVSKVSLITELGHYLYRKTPIEAQIYQRYGLRVRITKQMSLLYALKAHFGQAEYMEFGVTYNIL